MSVELKVYGGALFVKDKALKENPELKNLVLFINAPNKSAAEAIIAGKLAEHYPANMGDYFKAKVWEHREELPAVEPGAFCTDFFETLAVWNASANEPAAMPQPELDDKVEQEENAAAGGLKTVSKLDQHSRAACLALYGPVAEINKAQYNKVIDLLNIDNGSFQYQLAQAFIKEPRALALSVERQEEMLAWIRETMLVSTLCPDIKKALSKWIDTPAGKRETVSNDHVGQDKKAQLKYNIALGIIARSMDFDITNTPREIEQRANDLFSDKNETRLDVWFLQLSRTPGVYDFHPAVIIAMIKTSHENIQSFPGEIRKHIDKTIAALNCSAPDALIMDIACGRTSLPIPHIVEANTNDETQPPVSREALSPAGNPKSDAELNAEIDRAMADQQISEQLAAERGEFVPGISDPADPQWVDGSAQPVIECHGNGLYSIKALTCEKISQKEQPVADDRCELHPREIEIAHALNDLISGRTDIMSKNEAADVVAGTGHIVGQVIPLLITDLTTVELCLSPDFTDEEIHDVATTLLDEWSDDCYARQKIASDAIVEYRRPFPPKPISIKPEKLPTPEKNAASVDSALTYRQQLTIAALQGLCANPACRGDFDRLPDMASALADGIINQDFMR